MYKAIKRVYFSSAGLHGAVQAPQSLSQTVQKGAQLHETDSIAQVPGGVRAGEGDQSGQPVAGAVRKVSRGGRWEVWQGY